MGRLLDVYRSALGKKVLMAASGIVLFGFVLVHMLGNLKLYQGPEKLNAYAEWLRDFGYPALPHEGMLWIARIVLLGAVVLHIVSATQLTLLNRRARPSGYTRQEYLVSSYASRTMIWGGVIIALFVVYHLLHLTLGTVHPAFDAKDVYGNVVSAFRIPWVAAIYIVANLALGFHLFHGLWSMFQTLGWANPKNHDWRRTFAIVFAVVVTAGNVSFPVTVMLRLVS